MTPEQFAAITDRLDAIIEILRDQTYVPEGASACPHEKAVDMGVMGDTPGARMRCYDCNEIFSRIMEE